MTWPGVIRDCGLLPPQHTVTAGERWPGSGGRRLVEIGFAVGLGLASAGCAQSSPAESPTSGHGSPQHEVFCMGSRVKCDGTAAAFCESRYGSPDFDLVRRVPERGALVIACAAE